MGHPARLRGIVVRGECVASFSGSAHLVGVMPSVPTDPDMAEPHTPNRCCESLCEFETPLFAVRVWRTELDLGSAIDADDLATNADVYRAVKGQSSSRGIFAALEVLPRIAAIQVRNKASGAVALLYPDWGNERP